MNNTIQAKCIQKFRDKQNKIYGYRLVDLNGQTQDVKSENLKAAIKNGTINVVNLTLTSDGRLMDTNTKQLQSSKLGEAPKEGSSGADVTALAKAFVFIGVSLLDMGDSYEEVVSLTCLNAGLKVDTWEYDSQDELEKLETKAYKILIKKRDKSLVSLYESIVDDEYEYYTTINNSMYDENVSKLSDSETYKAMCLIYKYFCSVDKDIAKGIKEKMLDEMKINGVASARMGAAIGREYYKYLDSKIFGIGSNDFFTVGHTLTTNEKKEFPVLRPYSYMFNKQIGGPSPRPEVGPTFLFKNGTSGKVIVDVKMYRQGYVSQNTCSTVAYIKNLGTFELDTRKSDTENAKIVAQYCNKLGTEIRKFAQKNQTLLQMLPLGAKPEYF